jgi:hypothetical protein
MLRRTDVEKVLYNSAYCEIEKMLDTHKDTFFTKEEIYMAMPIDEDGVPLITIGSLSTALSNLIKCGHIECVTVRNTRYYGYKEDKRGW